MQLGRRVQQMRMATPRGGSWSVRSRERERERERAGESESESKSESACETEREREFKEHLADPRHRVSRPGPSADLHTTPTKAVLHIIMRFLTMSGLVQQSCADAKFRTVIVISASCQWLPKEQS
eukprot:6173697-Pleurochrysis_carterae.AAC.2